ncbi:pantoate--beta-alanine ligase [Ilumatobacter sp.]|uniref:pantoate--beta-alanine ligase n=1 Tax=Ilumatobacter sp. TaxID=1967498 RepID=UPI003C68E868
MLTLTDPAEMRAWSRAHTRSGRTIGFVPTMGALHTGHLALIADAQRRCDEVVVSIFVNPLQFNEAADFDSYPRPIDADVAACESAGVAVVYAPTARTMYPERFQTRVVPGALAEQMEGPGRPGHFEGVVTVVAKLFGAVRPDAAIFGQKDFQQLAIITAMSADLDLGIEIIGHPIVREDDGLALSSRNVRLTADQRDAARCVPRSLDAACEAAARDEATAGSVTAAALRVIEDEPLARLEYSTVFDPGTLAELDAVTRLTAPDGSHARPRIATAVWFGDVRLIDNRDLFGS